MRLIDADHLRKCISGWQPYNQAEYGARYEFEVMIDHEPTIGGWISVKDRLPEPPAQCLVYSNKSYRPRGMETATYTNLGWMTAAYFPEITHWMPLPEPPEEVSGDGQR